MADVRSGFVVLLTGAVVAGLVSAPPVAGAGGGVVRAAPQVAAPADRSAVVVPLATGMQRPKVVFTSRQKLVVNVHPNLSGSTSWKFALQRKSGGQWRRVGIYRTRGAQEVRRFPVAAGKYRVRVFARPGFRSVTTEAYRFRPRGRPTVVLRSTPKLVVNVNPNLSGSKSWQFTLKRKSGGEWSGVGVYRTRGAAEVRRLRVEPGKYRVRVHERPGYRSVTTKTYRHTPTVVTTRVSVRSDGGQSVGGDSHDPAISAEGRWIAYSSGAANLVADDTNGADDVFLFDRATKRTRLVSVRTDGGQANGYSLNPAISADGRWITYTSDAANLVDNDTNDDWDVFLFDRDTGKTRRVSVSAEGAQANGRSEDPAISADGRWITYHSRAENLVANDTNGVRDVFLLDRDSGRTRQVSVPKNAGSGHPAISADGRWITYHSHDANLVANDTIHLVNVFLFDRDTGQTRLVSVRTDGGRADIGSYSSAISADGRWITYHSFATNLVENDTNGMADVFLFDRDTGRTRLVSVAADGGQTHRSSSKPAISADGRWITYSSAATNLVENDTNRDRDMFLFDRRTGQTQRVSVRTDGGQADGNSLGGSISADGRWVTYDSHAANLVDNDTNRQRDVFLTRMW